MYDLTPCFRFTALLSAAIFGNVSSIMLRMYQGSDDYQERVSSIKEFINFHHLPKNLATRLQESFQHAWAYTNGVDMGNVRHYRQQELCGCLTKCFCYTLYVQENITLIQWNIVFM